MTVKVTVEELLVHCVVDSRLLGEEVTSEYCNEKNGPGKKWPARAIFFCKNWAPLAKIGPGTVWSLRVVWLVFRLRRSLGRCYTTAKPKGGERYPDGCSESRKRCIRKKAKSFVLEDGEMYYL